MTPLLLCLTNAIYATQRTDNSMPQRIELEPAAYRRLQADHRAALPAFDVEVVLMGTVAGVPTVESDVIGGSVVHADGSRTSLTIPPPL